MRSYKKIAIIEKTHGHKGTLLVKPLVNKENFLNQIKNVVLIHSNNQNFLKEEIYEVKKYRRGKFLIKFRNLKWINQVEDFSNYVMAV